MHFHREANSARGGVSAHNSVKAPTPQVCNMQAEGKNGSEGACWNSLDVHYYCPTFPAIPIYETMQDKLTPYAKLPLHC